MLWVPESVCSIVLVLVLSCLKSCINQQDKIITCSTKARMCTNLKQSR